MPPLSIKKARVQGEAMAENGDGEDTAGRRRLVVDQDVDVVVVGAGIAGLTAALEASRKGASVVVLEARKVGSGASGQMVGSVMPGFSARVADIVARIGPVETRKLWAHAQAGAEWLRQEVLSGAIDCGGLTDGALEVSNVDTGDELISRLQMLNDDFGIEAEGWQTERVRDVLKTDRYFHAIHYPKAFQVDGRRYVHALAHAAERAGVRIFEDTPLLGFDAAGVRKRTLTPSAKLRSSHLVLAGNIDLGRPSPRLAATLLPVWRYAAVTEPLGDRLAEIVNFPGSICDLAMIDQFRVVDGDRLMWCGLEGMWGVNPARYASAFKRRIAKVFPMLGKVAIAETWGAAIGQTVHGMPQIGALREGLWVMSGFGRQGLGPATMAGKIVAEGMIWGDQTWRAFSPFELVWAGGTLGRIVNRAIGVWSHGENEIAGSLARYRERSQARERTRMEKAEAVKAREPRRPRPSGSRTSPVLSAPRRQAVADDYEAQPETSHESDAKSRETM